MFVPFAKKLGEIQAFRLTEGGYYFEKDNETKPDAKGKTRKFKSFYYKCEYFGSDTTLRNPQPVPADDQYGDWTYVASGITAELIDSVNPQAGDCFYVKKGGTQGGKKIASQVFMLNASRQWEELHKPSKEAPLPGPNDFPPANEPVYEPIDDHGNPVNTAPAQQPQGSASTQRHSGQQTAPMTKPVQGWQVTAVLVSSVTAGLCHPSARNVVIGSEQFTSLMIATEKLFGGKWGDAWKGADYGAVMADIDRNVKLIKEHGLPPHLLQVLKANGLEPSITPDPATASDDDPAQDEPDDEPDAEPAPDEQAQAKRTGGRRKENRVTEPKQAQQTPTGDDPRCPNENPSKHPHEAPSEALLAYWESQGLNIGDKDELGRTVTNTDGLPF